MLLKCLKRDEGWKQFYDEHVRNTQKDTFEKGNDIRMKLADAERKAFQSAISSNPNEAAKILQLAVDESSLNDKEKGWYLQKIAKYVFEVNPTNALEIQRAAYERNNMTFCSPVATKRPLIPEKFDVQTKVIDWFRRFANPNGSIAAIQEFRAKLSYEVSPNIIEEAIKDLAQLLGASGSRPEKEFGEGPDDLWLWPSLSLVIEAKNENEETLHKKDAGQLLLSLQWFSRNFQPLKPPIPVMVAKVSVADRKAGFPEDTRVLTPEKMNHLIDNLETFYKKLVDEPSLLSSPAKILELQTALEISPEQFRGRYTLPLKESR
jgi:hypothetical protein